MSNKLVYFPALDMEGWVTSGVHIADYIFSHFFLSDYSQTQLYLGHVSSLSWILQTHQNDIRKIVSTTENTLRSYFQRYFNNVVAEVTYDADPTNLSKLELTIYVSFEDSDGKQHTLGRLLNVINSKIAKVKKINNG